MDVLCWFVIVGMYLCFARTFYNMGAFTSKPTDELLMLEGLL